MSLKRRDGTPWAWGITPVLVLALSSLLADAVLAKEAEEPLVGEEILDLALAHCKRGDAEQAEALFVAILDQLNPPEPVRKIVLALQKQGCVPESQFNWRGGWELRAGGGYDSNVTQGITASSLLLGSPEAPIELLVDDSYRPQPSEYADFSLQRTWKLSRSTQLSVKGGLRAYAQLPNYDQAQINVLLRSNSEWAGQPVQWAVERAELWLGGHYYHSAWSVAAQLPWRHQPQWRWAGLLQQLTYHTQSEQDARVLQLGLQHVLRIGSGELLLGANWQWDRAQGVRAGGDRMGPQVQAQGHWPLEQWSLSGRLAYTQWTSEAAFLPGLLDVKRRNRLLQWAVQAEYPISATQAWQLGLNQRSSKDQIGLYSYRSWGVSFNWTSRF